MMFPHFDSNKNELWPSSLAGRENPRTHHRCHCIAMRKLSSTIAHTRSKLSGARAVKRKSSNVVFESMCVSRYILITCMNRQQYILTGKRSYKQDTPIRACFSYILSESNRLKVFNNILTVFPPSARSVPNSSSSIRASTQRQHKQTPPSATVEFKQSPYAES